MIIAPSPPPQIEGVSPLALHLKEPDEELVWSSEAPGGREEGEVEKERKDGRWNMKRSFGRLQERADGIGKCRR